MQHVFILCYGPGVYGEQMKSGALFMLFLLLKFLQDKVREGKALFIHCKLQDSVRVIPISICLKLTFSVS